MPITVSDSLDSGEGQTISAKQSESTDGAVNSCNTSANGICQQSGRINRMIPHHGFLVLRRNSSADTETAVAVIVL